MSDLLEGKKAIITGSSRGIGRSIALEFARQGADVVVNYAQSKDAAEEVAAEVQRLGRKALVVKASVNDRLAVQNLIKKTEQEFGTVDIIVNNAGLTKDVLLMMMSEEAWDSVLETNLKGLFYCCKEVMRTMIKQKSGSIVNIASLSGVSGRPGQCNYAASKGGVIAFTKSLAQEVGRFSIRVNAIAPGLIEAGMTENLPQEILNVERIALRRLGTLEEVAKAAVFLASDMSTYTTGAVLHVNGGLYM